MGQGPGSAPQNHGPAPWAGEGSPWLSAPGRVELGGPSLGWGDRPEETLIPSHSTARATPESTSREGNRFPSPRPS